MPGDEIYQDMVQARGNPYRQDQIAPYSHYRDPIDRTPGRLAGNSTIWGDASPEVQSRVIDLLVDTSRDAGLNARQTAHVLAIARAESGFNPDAAAGTTSAHGIGQFINKTGAAYGLNDSNRTAVALQARALVAHFQDNQRLARARGQGEEYIYKYHHDGPNDESGGLSLSRTKVMPYLADYEAFVRRRLGVPAERIDNVGQPHPTPGGQSSSPREDAPTLLVAGMSGPQVRQLQERLNALGFNDDRGLALQEDGRFGQRTAEALLSFQRDYGLREDGVAGPRVRSALTRTEQLQQQPVSEFSEQSMLKQGTHGSATRSLQEALNQLGYSDARSQPLATHGLFNASTSAAVREFQRDHGLSVDGIVGPDTTAALRTAATAPLLNHPDHPDHSLFKQARNAVQRMDNQQGRVSDHNSDCLAAALTVAARSDGLDRIDEVLLYRNGAVASAIQYGQAGIRDRYASVDTTQALNQTLADSSRLLKPKEGQVVINPAPEPLREQPGAAQVLR